jgi:hypothetical protein
MEKMDTAVTKLVDLPNELWLELFIFFTYADLHFTYVVNNA